MPVSWNEGFTSGCPAAAPAELSHASSSPTPGSAVPVLRWAGAKRIPNQGPSPPGPNLCTKQGWPPCLSPELADVLFSRPVFPSCSSLSSQRLSQGRGTHSRETGLRSNLLPSSWSRWFCVSLSLPSGSGAPSCVPIQS